MARLGASKKTALMDLLSGMLGIHPPFVVERVEVDDVGLRVLIHVRYSAAEWEGQRIYDHAPVREWQHLAWFQYHSYIVCELPRIIGPDGKVRTVRASWATERKGYTRLFAAHIIRALQAVKVQSKVAELFRTTPYMVRSIMEEALESGLRRRGTVSGLRYVSIDEKAYARGHAYASILMDDQRGAVLDMVQDRTEESTRALFQKVTGQNVCESIERVNSDMWRPFMKVAGEVAPNALQMHDKFHLFKKLSDAIDTTRRAEVKEQPLLKESRYAVLKNVENRTPKQQDKFEQIDALNLKTAQAWRIRENFKEISLHNDPIHLDTLFQQWATNAFNASISAVTKVIHTFQNHLQGILNAAITRTTSAKHERTNGNIQSIIAKARGFKTFDRFRLNILFYFGKLDLLTTKVLV